MSTYWGLYCTSCPETSDPWSGCAYHSSYKDGLSKYARASQLIKQFQANKEMPDDLRLTAEFADDADFLVWLVNHAGHAMMLYNEYGHIEPLKEPPQ